MRQRKIVCCGIYRTGSTWLYNIVRVGLKAVGMNPIGYFYPDMYLDLENNISKYDISVVKTHNYYAKLVDADMVLCSRRNLFDTIASAIRKGIINQNEKDIKKFMETMVIPLYESWAPLSHFIMDYEEMIQDKQAMAMRVFDLIGIKVHNAKEIVEEIEGYAVPGEKRYCGKTPFGYDSITMLNGNHFTDGRPDSYLKTLEKRFIDIINDKYGKWAKENGFLK